MVIRVHQENNGVLIRPKRLVDSGDVLTRKESALVKQAQRQLREGKYVALAQPERYLRIAANRSSMISGDLLKTPSAAS